MYESSVRKFTAGWIGTSKSKPWSSEPCAPRVNDSGIWTAEWVNSRSGSDLPNWRDKILAFENATTAFSGSREFVRVRSESYMKSARSSPANGQLCSSTVEGVFVGVPGHLSTAAQSVEASNQAKSRLIREISGRITPLLGGVFLGELGKTLRMIRNPMVSAKRLLGRYDENLKKGSRLPSRLRRDHLRDAYLEFTFGWTPLVFDVRNGLAALQILKETRPYQIEKFTQRGKSSDAKPGNKSLSTVNLNSVFSWDTTKEDFTSWIKAGIRIGTPGSEASLPEVLGFLPKHFYPTAWELLPYSFIVDYFSNVGDIITAWSIINGRMAWGCETLRHTLRTVRTSSDATNTTFPAGDVKTSRFRPDVIERVTITCNRSSVGTLIPDLQFELPGFGTRQALNVATILHQINRRSPYF